MSTAIICCKMIENEFKKISNTIATNIHVYWLEAGLHNTPEKLHYELQNILDNIPESCNRVILLYGLCGKAIIDLKTRNFEMVIPKFDDCISLLLGSNENKRREKATYFLTDHWLLDENNILSEYNYAKEKYGVDRSERIFRSQFKNYSTLGFLDTGCYDVQALIDKTNEFTTLLDLTPKKLTVTYEPLSKLIAYARDNNKPVDLDLFLLINKNSTVEERYFFDFYKD